MSEVIEFISPFSFDDCKRRLAHRSEDATFWAWRGEMRTEVDVQQTDPVTASFEIYRMPKSYLTPQWKLFRTKVSGRLRAGKDGSTLVVYQLDVNAGDTFFYWVIMIVFSIAVTSVAMTTPDIEPVFLSLIGFFGMAIIFAFGYFYRKYEHRLMLNVVTQALADDVSL